MERISQVVLGVHAQVADLTDPTDVPVTVKAVSAWLGWQPRRVLALLSRLHDDGFVKCSPLSDPPLLYLTKTGLAFALRRRSAA